MPKTGTSRTEALQLAVQLYAGKRPSAWTITAVIDAAGAFAKWLDARPAQLALSAAPFTFSQGPPGPGVPTRYTGGNSMSVTMTDDQEVTYTVAPEDDKGFPVSDTLTWSESSGGAVVTVTPSADTLSALFVSVAPGTSTISVTDGTLSATDIITVTAGTVASLVLTPGTPVAETPPST